MMARDRPTTVAGQLRPSKKLPSFLSQSTLPVAGEDVNLRGSGDSSAGTTGGGGALTENQTLRTSAGGPATSFLAHLQAGEAGMAWGSEVAEVAPATLAFANETSRASTPAMASPLPRINESKQRRASTASTLPGQRPLRQSAGHSRPASRSVTPSSDPPSSAPIIRTDSSLDTSAISEGAWPQSWGSSPSLHSPKAELRRENTHLKRELEQMQSAMLESMRRTDRFISGGQFRGKTTNHGSPMTQALLREKDELKRSRAREWELMREKEGLETELGSAVGRLQELEATKVSLTQDLRAARSAAASRGDQELQQLEELHRSSRADLEARIEALERENGYLLSKSQAQTARLQASELESEHSASLLAKQLAEQARLTSQAEIDADEALTAAQRQVAELTSELLVGKDKAGMLASELDKAQAAALKAQEEQERKQAERELWQKEMLEARDEQMAQLQNLMEENSRIKSEYESQKKELQTSDCQTEALSSEQVVSRNSEEMRERWVEQISRRSDNASDMLTNQSRALCFHVWRSMVSDAKRRNAAELAERERRQSQALSSARDGTLSELKEERSRHRASISRCDELEAEKQNLKEQSSRAQDLWNKLQGEAVRLRECAEGAQSALASEKSAARQREQALNKSFRERISELEATIRELRAALMRAEGIATQAEQQANEYETRMRALRAQLAKEQERSDIEAAKLRRLSKDGEDQHREVEDLRKEMKQVQENLRNTVAQRNALESRLEELEAVHRLQLEAARQSSAQEKLRQMLRLQVLAPQVTVSISGHSTVDVKGAPSVGQIKKVMMDKVLPRFAQVMLQEDDQKPSLENGKSTEQYVQSVMNSMVTSIEEKLQSVLGSACVRTAAVAN